MLDIIIKGIYKDHQEVGITKWGKYQQNTEPKRWFIKIAASLCSTVTGRMLSLSICALTDPECRVLETLSTQQLWEDL